MSSASAQISMSGNTFSSATGVAINAGNAGLSDIYSAILQNSADMATAKGTAYMCPTHVPGWAQGRNELGEHFHANLKAYEGTGMFSQPEGVVYFIGDGMSEEIVSMTENIKAQAKWNNGDMKADGTPYEAWDQTIEKAYFRKDEWAQTMVSTHAYDTFVPDSASTAAGINRGVAGNFGSLGQLPSERSGAETGTLEFHKYDRGVAGIMQVNKLAGRPVGFTADSRITHATPAATFSNAGSRGYESSVYQGVGISTTDTDVYRDESTYEDLAIQLLLSGFGVPDVLLGYGERNFCMNDCAHGGSRRNDIDIFDKLTTLYGDKVKMVSTEAELKAFMSDPAELAKVSNGEIISLVGLFAYSHAGAYSSREDVEQYELYELERALASASVKYMEEVDAQRVADGMKPMYTKRIDLTKTSLDTSIAYNDYQEVGESASTQPTLAEMTDASVKFLKLRSEYLESQSGKKEPYMFFAEASQIDWGLHGGDNFWAASEVINLERAVEAADKASGGNAMLLVTADHSHTLSSGGYNGRTDWWNEPGGAWGRPLYTAGYGYGQLNTPAQHNDYMFGGGIAQSPGWGWGDSEGQLSVENYPEMEELLKENSIDWKFVEGDPDDLLPYQKAILDHVLQVIATQEGLSHINATQSLLDAAETFGIVGVPNVPREVALSPGFRIPSTYFANGGSHGASHVPVYCKGPGDSCAPMQLAKGGARHQSSLMNLLRCALRTDTVEVTKNDITAAQRNIQALNTLTDPLNAKTLHYCTDINDPTTCKTGADVKFHSTPLTDKMASNLLPAPKTELDAKSTTVIPNVNVAAELLAARQALGDAAVMNTKTDLNYNPADTTTNKFFNLPSPTVKAFIDNVSGNKFYTYQSPLAYSESVGLAFYNVILNAVGMPPQASLPAGTTVDIGGTNYMLSPFLSERTLSGFSFQEFTLMSMDYMGFNEAFFAPGTPLEAIKATLGKKTEADGTVYYMVPAATPSMSPRHPTYSSQTAFSYPDTDTSLIIAGIENADSKTVGVTFDATYETMTAQIDMVISDAATLAGVSAGIAAWQAVGMGAEFAVSGNTVTYTPVHTLTSPLDA